MTKKNRIIFAGTSDFAATHLQYLIDNQYNIIAVLTQTDKAVGRGHKIQFNPVKTVAINNNIDVIQPKGLKKIHNQQKVFDYPCDLMIVIAYGMILPPEILSFPNLGCINVHASLLPKWRGAAPIQRAIQNGDKKSGICIMQMDAGLDTGDVLLTRECDIEEQDNSETLFKKLETIGKEALKYTLDNIEILQKNRLIQDHDLSTYAHKIEKIEGQINWQEQTAKQICLNIKAFTPWPNVFFAININNQLNNIKIIKANDLENINGSDNIGCITKFDKTGLYIQCKEGILQITELQLPGKKSQKIGDFFNGNRNLFIVGQLIQ